MTTHAGVSAIDAHPHAPDRERWLAAKCPGEGVFRCRDELCGDAGASPVLGTAMACPTTNSNSSPLRSVIGAMAIADHLSYDRIGRGYATERRTDRRDCRSVIGLRSATRGRSSTSAPALAPTSRPVSEVGRDRAIRCVMRARRPAGSTPSTWPDTRRHCRSRPRSTPRWPSFSDHHWTDPLARLREMRRVARRVVVLQWDFGPIPDYWLVRDYLPRLRRGRRPGASHARGARQRNRRDSPAGTDPSGTGWMGFFTPTGGAPSLPPPRGPRCLLGLGPSRASTPSAVRSPSLAPTSRPAAGTRATTTSSASGVAELGARSCRRHGRGATVTPGVQRRHSFPTYAPSCRSPGPSRSSWSTAAPTKSAVVWRAPLKFCAQTVSTPPRGVTGPSRCVAKGPGQRRSCRFTAAPGRARLGGASSAWLWLDARDRLPKGLSAQPARNARLRDRRSRSPRADRHAPPSRRPLLRGARSAACRGPASSVVRSLTLIEPPLYHLVPRRSPRRSAPPTPWRRRPARRPEL